MKKILLLPTALFPYTFCVFLAYGFASRKFSGNPIMEALGIICLTCLILAFICNIIFIIISRKADPISLLKTSIILKAIHIPTYVLIFVLGIIMGLMFFMTFPFILFLVVIDYLTLLLTGMVSMFSLIKNTRNNAALSVIAIFLQFVFCADIISLIVAVCATKSAKKTCSA